MTQAWLNRIGTAVPPHDIHAAFVDIARSNLADPQQSVLFERMAAMSDIEHRYSFLQPGPLPRDRFLDAEGFYQRGAFPSTAARMARYEPEALQLALGAINALNVDDERSSITHLVVASCTGFSAPGLDFQILRATGLSDTVERTIVGFMGCFAAVNSLKLAHHIVRSDPDAKVLVVNLELSSLHLQDTFQDLPRMLSFLLFADGASAALVSAAPEGIAIGLFRSALIPRSEGLITWHIRDSGFEMHLSGQVPGRIRRWLPTGGPALLGDRAAGDLPLWAVHAGGRSILDAVQQSLNLPPEALRFSRGVLRDYGNMSSATLMFVLARILADPDARGAGIGMAFGPGVTVESFGMQRP